jgi:hypothetical protein
MPELSLPTAAEPIANPLDLIEEIITAHEWPFDRANDDELMAQIPGKWCDYRLYFAWSGDMSALHFSCALDLKLPTHRRVAINELLALTNERLWLGHFDLSSEDCQPTFRHAVPLRGARGATVEQLEDLVEVALHECERFYPAFQYVIWGGKNPAEAVTAACLDPVGEA